MSAQKQTRALSKIRRASSLWISIRVRLPYSLFHVRYQNKKSIFVPRRHVQMEISASTVRPERKKVIQRGRRKKELKRQAAARGRKKTEIQNRPCAKLWRSLHQLVLTSTVYHFSQDSESTPAITASGADGRNTAAMLAELMHYDNFLHSLKVLSSSVGPFFEYEK